MELHPIYESLPQDFKRLVAKDAGWFIPHSRTMNEFIVLENYDEEVLEERNCFKDIPVIVKNKESLKFCVPPYSVDNLEVISELFDPDQDFDVTESKNYRPRRIFTWSFDQIMEKFEDADWRDGVAMFIAEMSVDENRIGGLKIEPPMAIRQGDIMECRRQEQCGGTVAKNTTPELNYLKNLQLGSPNYFTAFHQDLAGAMVFFHILDGTKIFMLVNHEEGDVAIHRKWREKLKLPELSSNEDIIPKGFHGRIHLFELTKGMTLIFPSSNFHAVFTPVTTLVMSANTLEVPQLPKHIACNKNDVEQLDADKLFPNFDDGLIKGLPMVAKWIIDASYEGSPDRIQRLQTTINAYSTQCPDSQGSDLLWYTAAILTAQGKDEHVLMHVTGAVFRREDYNVLKRLAPFRKNSLLTNLIFGNCWRNHLSADPGDPDYVTPAERKKHKLTFPVKKWYNPLPDKEAKVVFAFRNGFWVPVANVNLKSGELAGEIRGEILLHSQLLQRYHCATPNAPIHVLHTIRSEDGKTEHVYVDSSIKHGLNGFCDKTLPANCTEKQIVIGARRGLAVMTNRDIPKGEQLSLGNFLYSSLYPTPTLNIQPIDASMFTPLPAVPTPLVTTSGRALQSPSSSGQNPAVLPTRPAVPTREMSTPRRQLELTTSTESRPPSFEESLRLLPAWTCAEIEASNETKSSGKEKYWETNPWFISAVIGSGLLGCTSADNFVDVTSGQGLIVLQASHLGFLAKCVGIETQLGRHNLAMNLLEIYKTEMQRLNRAISDVEFLHGEFQDQKFSELLSNGIIFAACNKTGGRCNGLMKILSDAQPGTRVLSNCLLASFALETADPKYQIIEITQDPDTTAPLDYVKSELKKRHPVPQSTTNPEKVAKFTTRADPIPATDPSRVQYSLIDRDELEETFATSTHITSPSPLAFPGSNGAPTIPPEVYAELKRPTPDPVTTRGGHATIPPLQKGVVVVEKSEQHKQRNEKEPNIKITQRQFPDPNASPTLPADFRIGKDKVLGTAIPHPNTTSKRALVPFYLYTVRNWSKIQKQTAQEVWKVDEIAFVPVQIRQLWTSYKCKLLEQSENKKKWLVELVTPEIAMRVLQYTMWTKVSELFRFGKRCEEAVRERNTSLAGHPEQETVAQLKHSFLSTGQPTKYMLENVLPASTVRMLGLTTQNIILIPDNGIKHRGMEFDVVTTRNVFEWLASSKPYSLSVPVIFRGEASARIGVVLPNEDPSELSFTLKGLKQASSQKWRLMKTGPGFTQDSGAREPQPLFHVHITNEAQFSFMHSSETVDHMISYLGQPLNQRKHPESMPMIPIINNTVGHLLQPPRFLSNEDLIPGAKKLPLNFTPMNKYTAIHGQNSTLRFHCHMDGSVVWTSVAAGVKIMFFLLKPTSDDYDFLATCSEANAKNSFMTPDMIGRVVYTPIWPGETVVYPGSIPHAIVGVRDILAYGGRFITTLGIPRLLKFGDTRMKSKCKGEGYDFGHIASILYGSASKIFAKLWQIKCSHPALHITKGIAASRAFEIFLTTFGKQLNIKLDQFNVMKDWFKLLRIGQGTAFEQSVAGFYYGDVATKRKVEALFENEGPGVYTPVLCSSGEGTLVGSLKAISGQNLQHSTLAFQRFPNHQKLPNNFYETNYCCTPEIVMREENDYGFYAIKDLRRIRPIALMTGILRTYEEMIQIYGLPSFGKAYVLKDVDIEGKGMTTLWIDSNKHGGFSLFVRPSKNPNCKILPATIQNQAVLLVVTDRDISRDDEILIPMPPTPALVNPESVAQAIRRMYDPKQMASLVKARQQEEIEVASDDGSEGRLVIDESAPTVSTPSPVESVDGNLENVTNILRPTPHELPEPEDSETHVSEPVPAISTRTLVESFGHNLAEPEDSNSPVNPNISDGNKIPETPLEPSGKRKASKTPSPVPPSPEPATTTPVGRRVTRMSSQAKKLKLSKEPPHKDAAKPGPSNAGRQSPQPGPSTPQPGPSTAAQRSPQPGPSSAQPGPSTAVLGSVTAQPSPTRAGKPSQKSRKSKTLTRKSSGSSSEEEEHADEEPGTFRMGTEVIRKEWIRSMPHDLNREVFDALPAAAQQQLRDIPVGLFYADRNHYLEINETLKTLYGKLDLHVCAVCAHLCIPTDMFGEEAFHQYRNKYKIHQHYERYHETRYTCTICKKEFNTARRLRAHLEAQLKNPTGYDHRKKENKSLKSLQALRKDKRGGNHPKKN